mgnify:FL=1
MLRSTACCDNTQQNSATLNSVISSLALSQTESRFPRNSYYIYINLPWVISNLPLSLTLFDPSATHIFPFKCFHPHFGPSAEINPAFLKLTTGNTTLKQVAEK